MDKNGRLFGKISIFDLIVVLLIGVVGIGTFYKFNSEQTNVSGGQKTIDYSLRISNVRDSTVKYYYEGLQCFDAKTGEEIGKIKAVRSETYQEIFSDQKGGTIWLDVPERIKIELDIETIGLETDQGYYANGVYELKAGAEVLLTTKYVDVSATIYSVEAQ